MKNFRVIVSPKVQEQVREQVLFIAEDSIDNAIAWQDRLLSAIYALKDLPGHALDVEASKRIGEPVHKLVFERTYLIHYRILRKQRTVQIVNFRHGARLPRSREP